jgi:hypothetical protein
LREKIALYIHKISDVRMACLIPINVEACH